MPDTDENLSMLAERLAFNMVSCSFPTSQDPKIFREIFTDKKMPHRRSRNILIIGAGASNNLCKKIPLASSFSEVLEKRFIERYKQDFYDRIIMKELNRLTNIYRLNINDFETQLAAYSTFDKDLVLEVLSETYNLRYPVSLFYELVAHLFKHRFIDVVINFNFDEILDNAIEEELNENEYKFIYSDGHCPEKGEEARQLIKSGRLKIPIYIKPHGTISHASTMRFTRYDYYNMPIRLSETLAFLIEGKTAQTNEEPLPVNLIVVGFGMNSFELNSIISDKLKKANASLFYFDCFKPEELADFENTKKPTDLKSFDNSNSFLFNLDRDNKNPENSLGNYFFRLCRDLFKKFEPGFQPKSISRHIIVAEIFNGIAPGLLPAHNTADNLQKNLVEYLRQRMLVELALEIFNCNDGILNITHIRQGRVGKFYNLLREHSSQDINLFGYLRELQLTQYTDGMNDTWIFDPSLVFKDKVQEIIYDKLSNEIREKTRRSAMSAKLQEAIEAVKNKKGMFLNIVRSFFETRISVFERINEDSLINTDLKWIYLFKKYFYNKTDLDKWNLVLSISENGTVFREPRILAALEGKKILMICSYNSKEGRTNRYNKLIHENFLPIRNHFLKDENGTPLFKLLPMRSHNQHIVLYCKVVGNEIKPVSGIYYERRLMTKRVSPILIAEHNYYDLKSLKSIFLTYYERALKDELIDIADNYPQLLNNKKNIEKYIIERFLNS